MFSDTESVQVYSPKKLNNSSQIILDSKLTLKSFTKTRLSENTRADSLDSMTESSDVSKAISKKKSTTRQNVGCKSSSKILKSVKSVTKNQNLEKVRAQKSTANEYSTKFKKEFLNVQPLEKTLEFKTFKFLAEGRDHKLRISTFPLSYSVEYEQPQHGFEGMKEEVNINHIDSSISNKAAAKAKNQDMAAQQSVAKGVCFTSLSDALMSSKACNSKSGAVCFETFKSLKVLQAVSDYLDQ